MLITNTEYGVVKSERPGFERSEFSLNLLKGNNCMRLCGRAYRDVVAERHFFHIRIIKLPEDAIDDRAADIRTMLSALRQLGPGRPFVGEVEAHS